MTRTILTAFLLVTMSATVASLSAQPPSVAQGPDGTGTSATPSVVLRPALGSLQQAIDILRPEKWKAPATITSESISDVASIQRDLGTTLPPLLTAADAAPGSATQLLPAYRNIEALYDVLVRVTQTAVLAAPDQQSAALQQATSRLQQARREFGDLLQSSAQSQDRRLHDVQAQLRTVQNTPPPPAPVCAQPPPVVKRAKPHAKPKPASQTAPSTSH